MEANKAEKRHNQGKMATLTNSRAQEKNTGGKENEGRVGQSLEVKWGGGGKIRGKEDSKYTDEFHIVRRLLENSRKWEEFGVETIKRKHRHFFKTGSPTGNWVLNDVRGSAHARGWER